MEITSINGDTVLLLYHPAETTAEVGQQYTILELPDQTEGLVVQIISNDSLEYAGIQQEMIQRILEERMAETERVLDLERGLEEIKSLKLATGKIRKRIHEGNWLPWDGWITTRNVEITLINASDLLGRILPTPRHPLQSFARFNNTPISFDGPLFNMVNVIAGVKGSGKSHLSKHLTLSLCSKRVPCIIFDINGEYTVLPNAQILRWGDNFVPDLAEVGHEMLSLVIRTIYPLPATSESVFDGMLPVAFAARRARLQSSGQQFTIDLDYLMGYTWNSNEYVQQAIVDRLRVIANMGLFVSPRIRSGVTTTNIQTIFENACNGRPVVFDMRGLSPTLQSTLVRAINKNIEDICGVESAQGGQGRFPFMFYEEAHFYIKPDVILNIITRGRHIGMASVFVTNTPHNLPDTVFRQLDNLFLLSLTHKDDIRNVSKNSFTDEDTIESFATRMPVYHSLIIGNVTDRYPLIVKVDPLPSTIPATGRTKSTWDRFSVSSTTGNTSNTTVENITGDNNPV
jgi:uncharacterized protein